MTEAYLCCGRRSPIGKFGGALAEIRADDLLAHVIGATLADVPELDPTAIDDVIIGCANQAGEDNRNVARMAGLMSDLPNHVPAMTVNRLCASGMDSVASVARAIRSGEAELCLAGGVESMSRAPFVVPKSDQPFGRDQSLQDTTMGWRFIHPQMKERFGCETMPQTGENVAERYKVSRDDQDQFAFRSQQRTHQSQQRGFFDGEITPVKVPVRRKDPIVVSHDEHPRSNTTLDALKRLKPFVKQDGTLTAGNSSGVNDGAAMLLLASDDAVAKYDMNPMAKVIGTTVVGLEPTIMGMGPVPATQRLLGKLGVELAEIGVIEINEAFASQSLAVLRELGLPDDAEHVNRNGGAIAIGHPLGMSGTRLLLTAARQLQEVDSRYALCTMCVGVGQGIAMLLEKA